MTQDTSPLNKFIENSQAQMRRGTLELVILAIIGKGPVYAGDILAQLTEAKLIVVEGTLYPILSRFRRESLVTYEWQESEVGPPRKYYALTDDGTKVLQTLRMSWNTLHISLRSILKPSERTKK